jgi:hypothetical protein
LGCADNYVEENAGDPELSPFVFPAILHFVNECPSVSSMGLLVGFSSRGSPRFCVVIRKIAD